MLGDTRLKEGLFWSMGKQSRAIGRQWDWNGQSIGKRPAINARRVAATLHVRN